MPLGERLRVPLSRRRVVNALAIFLTEGDRTVLIRKKADGFESRRVRAAIPDAERVSKGGLCNVGILNVRCVPLDPQ